ncbi:MAG: DUF1592 domain-containing protein [Opitutaceae bacterium]|nr:DUF1592 domain-containing protein [Opitutaceae bacterium]
MIKISSRHVRAAVLAGAAALGVSAAPPPKPIAQFIEFHCADCHDGDEEKGGLDFAALAFAPDDPKNFSTWVKIHDRASAGEMPPKKRERPEPAELQTFLATLSSNLTQAEQQGIAREGRATQRRLNRYEYENALRDLLDAPWLQVRDSLPEDGEAFRFNKVGDALDISHVQMARYMAAADYALRQVMAKQVQRPATATTRYYAREQRSFVGPMKFSAFNTAPERATFPVFGVAAQPEVRAAKAPMTVGAADPEKRELEGVGLVASTYEPLEPKFNQFKAPVAGHYRIRINAFSIWVGPGKPVKGKPDRWWIPDLEDVTRGRRSEPITVYSETPPRQLRHLGKFDVGPDPTVNELDVWLLAGETIRPDAARLFRSRPGAGRWQNPLAVKDGQPGVAFRWLEVEGPLYDEWPTKGHRLLFGDLPVTQSDAGVDVVSADPSKDTHRLLLGFMQHAYRRPVAEAEVNRFVPVVNAILKSGSGFADAMIGGYTSVLCSPEFICVAEKPGRLDDYAIASRLSFFLWNSAPDAELRTLAAKGKLHRPEVLRAQTERLLNHAKSRRFVDAFLDYWLDLRRIVSTAPDSTLYPDYYLDDLLAESALEETQQFFAELVRRDLPARNIITADFAIVNERLAAHYELPPIEGVGMRRVPVPPGNPRGGLLTQAAVLKVTANGTTTSPVLRGVWVMERILGETVPPPPASTPAIEPDIRGTTTLRQQLERHRTEQSCAVCHVKIDPPGFALESFDVMGGWRDHYRAIADGTVPQSGIGRGGQKFAFHLAQPVDATGQLPDGRKFSDIREFKQLLLDRETQVARNLGRQFIVYATGAPVRFSDRAALEKILQRTTAGGHGVRSLIHEIVQSDIFLTK